MPTGVTSQYVLLPERGLRVPSVPSAVLNAMTSVGHARSVLSPQMLTLPSMPRHTITVVDSIHEDGPKLVEMSADAALAVRMQQPGLRVEPVREYVPAIAPAFTPNPDPAATGSAPVILKVVCCKTGASVAGAEVTAFTNFAQNLGVKATSDARGEVRLLLGPTPVTLDRLWVQPPLSGFWGACKMCLTVSSGETLSLTPVDLSFIDAVRHFYGQAALTDGAGVKVGVIDTGVGPHPDLVVADGRNTVAKEPEKDFGDNGLGHGTHVAGIIAARGTPPSGLSGLAPGVELFSFRVFGAHSESATSYAILKAVVRAVEDFHCDIINLSLGGTANSDEILRRALEQAKVYGTLVVAAAGNDGRKPVQGLAMHASNEGLVVSAMGRKGTFPPGACEQGDIEPNPIGTDPENFMTAFTNIGSEISVTAPGVGILSTVPGGGYGPMRGTSMACPVVSGFAARLLASSPQVLNMPRDELRTQAIMTLVGAAAKNLGFPWDYQGSGIPL